MIYDSQLANVCYDGGVKVGVPFYYKMYGPSSLYEQTLYRNGGVRNSLNIPLVWKEPIAMLHSTARTWTRFISRTTLTGILRIPVQTAKHM